MNDTATIALNLPLPIEDERRGFAVPPGSPLWALTLTQPWATLVVLLEKRWETRGWPTKRRGRFAVHAAKGFPRSARQMFCYECFASVLRKHGINRAEDLPTGAIVGVSEILRCERTEDVRDTLSEQERLFGGYGPERFAYELGKTHALREPVPVNGALSFWRVPDAIASAVLGQVNTSVRQPDPQ